MISDVKHEPVFQSSHVDNYSENHANNVMYGNQQTYRRGRGYNRRGQIRYNRGVSNKQWRSSSDNRSLTKCNPTDSNGSIRTCDFCHSMYHFKNGCPDFKQSMGSYGASSQNENKYI